MLREQLLKLLEEDKEFRLIVAGLLGYGDILKRLESHDRKIQRNNRRIQSFTKRFSIPK